MVVELMYNTDSLLKQDCQKVSDSVLLILQTGSFLVKDGRFF